MLDVRDLRRSALAPVSFRLEGGECLAVRGPSGAGKSLLLRALADLDPSDGTVTWKGRDRWSMSGPEWRQLVGYLPAEPGWWGERVGEHFRDWHSQKDVLKRLGLPLEAENWSMTRPSTGERIRLALARALEAGPELLMLDEPTAALDALSAQVVEEIIEERRQAGLTVIWVTHDAAQGQRVASRRLVVEAGRTWLEDA